MSQLPNSAHTDLLREKWGLSDEEDKYRAAIAAIVMENHFKEFRSLSEMKQIPDQVAEKLGDSWQEDVIESIKRSWLKSPLPDMVSVQPATAPVATIAYFELVSSGKVDGVPTIHKNITTDPVAVPCRKLKSHINAEAMNDLMSGSFQVSRDEIYDSVFVEMMNEVTREVLGQMYWEAVNDKTRVLNSEESEVLDVLMKASTQVHKVTQSGPANRLIANAETLKKLGADPKNLKVDIAEVGVIDGRWKAYVDPLFPNNQIMTWYQGASILDTAVVYTPYRYQFEVVDKECSGFVAKSRHNIKLVQPGAIRVIQLPGADA